LGALVDPPVAVSTEKSSEAMIRPYEASGFQVPDESNIVPYILDVKLGISPVFEPMTGSFGTTSTISHQLD
jgi:hypothetical protein